MVGVLVVLLLLLLGGGAAAFLYMSKMSDHAASDSPNYKYSVPVQPPTSDSWSNLESLHNFDDFVPQDTIYSYHNPVPGVNCPNCDAESPAGLSFCRVCGSKLLGTKHT